MSTKDFTQLLTVSGLNRPAHVPSDYIRVDHWGAEFDGAQIHHYESNSKTKSYWNAVRKKHSRNSAKAKIAHKPGQKFKGTGIWYHPLIASHYAAWLNADFAVLVNETFLRVVEGDSDLAADMMIRDHNKDRVERAKKRVLVSGTNKETMELAKLDGARYADVHNDRYRGLYQLNASQLRQQGGLEKDQTPLDKLSAYDLNLNSLANQMALMAGSSAKVLEAANNLRQVHQQVVGTELTPTWEERLLRPNQARAIAYSSEYQSELPLSNV